METQTKGNVLVTGASGFVAGQVIHQLLQNDYKVFGTVRSLKDQKKVQYILDILPEKKHNITLVEADLNNKDSWDKVMPGMDFVMHVASPFPSKPPKHENDIIIPAKQGTTNVLNAVVKHGVKKVVLTSSVAAIYPGHGRDKLDFNENDWAVIDDPKNKISAYEKSKAVAEKEAWKIWNENKDKFQLAIINPSLVLGPRFGGNDFTSGDIVIKLLTNKFPGMPRIQFGLVDVRDVAKAHLQALENPDSNGKRYILSSRSLWFVDVAKVLKKEFSQYGYNVPTTEVGGCVLKFASVFDSQINLILPLLGKQINLNHQRAEKELNIQFIDPEKSLIDMGYDLIEKGFVPNKLKNKKK